MWTLLSISPLPRSPEPLVSSSTQATASAAKASRRTAEKPGKPDYSFRVEWSPVYEHSSKSPEGMRMTLPGFCSTKSSSNSGKTAVKLPEGSGNPVPLP